MKNLDHLHYPNLGRSRVPVTMVCGAPGSGKSTLVGERAGPNDLVIDVDEICSRLSGQPVHSAACERFKPQALAERNRILADLAVESMYERVWFIFGGARADDCWRWAWMLGAEVVTMPTSEVECVRRIQADAARSNKAEQIKWVRNWFAGGTPKPVQKPWQIAKDRKK